MTEAIEERKMSLEEEIVSGASRWAELENNIQKAISEETEAKAEQARLRTQIDKQSKQLKEKIGDRIPERHVRLRNGEVVQITRERVRLLPEVLTEC